MCTVMTQQKIRCRTSVVMEMEISWVFQCLFFRFLSIPNTALQNVDVISKDKRCGNRIKLGFLNVIIQDIAVHGTND